jgi:adenylyltransferase/sulfurtransferase
MESMMSSAHTSPSASAPDALWERYSRQILFAPLGCEGQQRLARAQVAIVGCGALGSAQAALLTRAGVGHLTLIDRDYVEWSNLQRQALFDEEDAREGMPKVIAASRRLQATNSAVELTPHCTDLTPANIETLLGGVQVILDGTDNFETRYLLNDFSVAHGIPWVYGAAVGSYGASFTILPGETACLECIFGEKPTGSVETCDTTGVLGWIIEWIAAVQVSECVKLLVGARAALRSSLLAADLWKNEFQQLRHLARQDDCRACGQRDFVHLRGDHRPPVTLCGRNAVQIHEHQRPLLLTELAARLRPHGEVRANDFVLRFIPREGWGAVPAPTDPFTGESEPAVCELTVFPDGRALIKGTTDPALARSIYARYIGN